MTDETRDAGSFNCPTMVLVDDGTLDTVIECTVCRERIRYFTDVDENMTLDSFISWARHDARDNHVCEPDPRQALTGAQQFAAIYAAKLAQEIQDHPGEYAYPVEDAATVAMRMVAAFQHHRGSNDSRAIRRTCKALGIRPTYEAIRQYVGCHASFCSPGTLGMGIVPSTRSNFYRSASNA